MKQAILFIVAFVFFSLEINAQTDIVVNKDTVLAYRNLSAVQKAAWDSLEEKWQYDIFRPECSASGFRQDCIVCGDIAWTVIFKVDANGKLSNLTIVLAEVLCDEKTPEQKKALEEKVLEWFRQQTFPPVLRNTSIEDRVGRFTRC